MSTSSADQNDNIEIVDVWQTNLKEEMDIIGDVIDDYPYVSIDTEYPGTIFQGFDYDTMKRNLEHTKVIQVGLTLSNRQGRYPTSKTDNTKQCVWQFNFREFDPNTDHSNQSAIRLLIESGMNFDKLKQYGITRTQFGESLVSSGVIMNDMIKFISFHGSYDFGYMLMIVSGDGNLPETEEEFFVSLKNYFPNIYDIKYLMNFTEYKFGGLKDIAAKLDVTRIGMQHQAGSDSLVTSRVFMKLIEKCFVKEPEHLSGVLYGMGIHQQS